MKPHLILALPAAFLAAVNAALAGSDRALEPNDITLTPDGRIAALLIPDPRRAPNVAGALHTVELLSGSAAEVEASIAAEIDKDPYFRPLKLLVVPPAPPAPVVPTEPGDQKPDSSEEKGEDETKSPETQPLPEIEPVEPVVIVVAGRFQP